MGEIRAFIDLICAETGVVRNADDMTLDEVFADMDEDGNNSVEFDELEEFLKRIFILQRDEISQVVKYNKKWLIEKKKKNIFNEEKLIKLHDFQLWLRRT